MNDQPALRKNVAEPDAAEVARFLAQHPDFFQDRQDLLDRMDMPIRQHGAGVADMQQYLLDRLREEIDTLRACTGELISVSRNNMTNQDRTHRAVLALLEAEGLNDFVDVLRHEMPEVIDIDVVALCLEQDGHFRPDPGSPIRMLADGAVDGVLGVSEDIWLLPDGAGDRAIFGDRADGVESAAFVRIEPLDRGLTGLLAFGSPEAGLFHPAQGTDLILFLAKVVEHGLRRWLTPAPGRA